MINAMISNALFLDILAVYVFVRYLLDRGQTGRQYISRSDLVLVRLSEFAMIVPLVYIFTPWFDFADYRLSLWFSLAGLLLAIVALWLLAKAHSSIVVIRDPIHAGFFLWAVAQPLILHNWIAGFVMLIIFIPLYLARMLREGRILPVHFGEAYRKE
jgi:protein-S-isoprenylcysteine O-methyltransferase Ste14